MPKEIIGLPLWKRFRYQIEGIALQGALLFFGALPIKTASFIGALLGRYFGPWLPVSRIAYHNLKQVMPEYAAEHKRIVQGMWENLGRTVAELPHLATLSPAEFSQYITLKGIEYLEQARLSPQGAIIFSAHIANWELSPRLAADLGMPMALVYRPANNPYVEKLIVQIRDHYQTEKLPKNMHGARKVLKVLQQKGWVGMLVDQKMNDGISVPFFGFPAMTAPAIARLALKYKCPIIPVQIRRTKGVHFEITIYPPLEIPKELPEEEAIYHIMSTVNGHLERWIREAPEQWLWVHKRWPFSKECR